MYDPHATTITFFISFSFVMMGDKEKNCYYPAWDEKRSIAPVL